jgi:hypothetical protein
MAHFLTAALYWLFGLVKGAPAKGFQVVLEMEVASWSAATS